MIEQQEPLGRSAPRRGRTVVALVLVASLAGCAALSDAIRTPEEAAAQQPTRVSSEGADESFPNLAEVPSVPRAHSSPEERQRIMAEMAADRAAATYTEPVTGPAPRDPFASTLIVGGQPATSTQFAALPPHETAAGPDQLAAIIFFGHGSAELDAGDLSVLSDVVTLQQQRGGTLRVVGHASSRTHNATLDEHRLANFEMSLTRAEVVREELRRLGVPAETVHAEALGDAEPVYHEFMPSGEAGNRRVEIFLEN